MTGRRAGGARTGFGADLRAALPGWVVGRVIVGGALIIAHVIDEQLGPKIGRHVIHHYVHQGLGAWDGSWYLRIARGGYHAVPASGLRFFPLYPVAARVLALALGGRTFAALLVLSNVGALAGAALLHRVALDETGDAALAGRVAWLVALLPPSFVFVMAYSEGLFLALSVGMMLALRRRRFALAAVLGLLVGLSRPTGVLLAVPALIEGARGARQARGGDLAVRLAAVVSPVAGLVAYLGWVGHVFGDALIPVHIQQQATSRGPTKNPIAVLAKAMGDASHNHWGGNAAHLVTAAVLIGLVVVACRRWPASYGALAAITVIVSLSATRIGSLERYGLLMFPLVLALGTATRHQVLERAAFALGAASLLAYGALAFVGLAVP